MSIAARLSAGTLRGWRGRRVLVFGDVILDRYVHGSVDRISPEAPVPIVRWREQEERLGGAANVVANLVSLGAEPSLVTLTGEDAEAETLARLLAERGVTNAGLVRVLGRPTTVKTRILAQHQQVTRLDREENARIASADADSLIAEAMARLDSMEALVISDYAKGVLDERTLPPLLEAARAAGLPVVVDPKLRNFPLYSPATVVTPNQTEALRATAREISGTVDLTSVGREILEKLDLTAVLITRGAAGMLLVAGEGPAVTIAAEEREVFDVTGAGDTVAATLALGLAAGTGLETAARWANAAAALAVGKLGTAAIELTELQEFAADSHS